MKTTMKAQMGQQLHLTPQLLQSIRLLQLTAPQLELEIVRALDANPMLERVDEFDGEAEMGDAAEPAQALEDADFNKLAIGDESNVVEIDGGMDDDFTIPGPWNSSSNSRAEGDDPIQRLAAREGGNLRRRVLSHLQLGLSGRTELAAAEWLVEQVDDNGYLTLSLDNLYGQAKQQFGMDQDCTETLRQKMMCEEPTGYGACDLRECLGVQLRELDDGSCREDIDLAILLVERHLELLAMRDAHSLAALLNRDPDSVARALRLILALQPHPGEELPDDPGHYICPDVRVFQRNGRWQVSLNALSSPRVRVNPVYEDLLGKTSEEGTGAQRLRELMQEARWLTRGLAMRYDTLLRTASAIVERQQAFLEKGEEAMLPLNLREIADAIGMHESTVSRITSGKYLQTPRGTFELKHFFPTRLEGASVSNIAIRAMVRRLIEAENPRLPLADDVIALMLARQGVHIARRTVAKYRDQLHIGAAKSRHVGAASVASSRSFAIAS